MEEEKAWGVWDGVAEECVVVEGWAARGALGRRGGACMAPLGRRAKEKKKRWGEWGGGGGWRGGGGPAVEDTFDLDVRWALPRRRLMALGALRRLGLRVRVRVRVCARCGAGPRSESLRKGRAWYERIGQEVALDRGARGRRVHTREEARVSSTVGLAAGRSGGRAVGRTSRTSRLRLPLVMPDSVAVGGNLHAPGESERDEEVGLGVGSGLGSGLGARLGRGRGARVGLVPNERAAPLSRPAVADKGSVIGRRG